MAKKGVSLPTAYQHPRTGKKPPRNNAALWFCLCLLIVFAVLIAGCTTDTRGRPGVAGAAGATGPAGASGAGNLTMNLTANMTAGPIGPTGPPGVNGTPGDPGVPGLPGANGAPGTPATADDNWTFTLNPGELANVTNIGTITDARFDFFVPMGATGAMGPMNQTINLTANLTQGAAGAPGGAGGLILYFTHSASPDIGGYESLALVPAGNAEADETITVKAAGGQKIFDSYVTELGVPGLAVIPAGLWQIRGWGYVDGASGTTNLVFKVYNRTVGGVETPLFTATSDDVNGLDPTLYTTYYTQTAPYVVGLTDRIVIKVYAQTDHAANIDVHWVYDGTSHTSNAQTPILVAEATTLTFTAQAGEALTKGQAVYISGASGSNPVVKEADNTDSTKCRVVGIMAANTASGGLGLVRRAGILTAVNSQATNLDINPNAETWLAGDLLFGTTGGGMTRVRPTSGRSVKVAYTMLGSNAADVLLAYPMENPVWVTAASGENVTIRLGDSAGVKKMVVRDYTNADVAYINSDGNALFNRFALNDSFFYRTVNDDYLYLLGGTVGGSIGGRLALYGGDNLAQSGGAIFSVGDAAGTSGIPVWSVVGRTDTPYLDLNAHQIKSLKDPTAAQDAVTKNYLQVMFGNGTAVNTSYDTVANNTNFLYKPGVDGGQWANGGTQATDNLTLDGTISSTKTFGNIILNPNGGNIGIATTIPQFILDVNGISRFVGMINVSAEYIYLGADNSGATPFPTGTTRTDAYEKTSALVAAHYTNSEEPILMFRAVALDSSNKLDIGGGTGNFNVPTQISFFTGETTTTLIGTARMRIDSTGTIIIPAFGAGTVMSDANGNLYIISDDKYKTLETPFTRGVSSLPDPITFKFNSASGLDTVNTYVGFSAQNLSKTIPEAVFSKPDMKMVNNVSVPSGTYTLSISDRAILAVAINAIKEQQVIINDQQAQIDNLTKRMEALEKKVGI